MEKSHPSLTPEFTLTDGPLMERSAPVSTSTVMGPLPPFGFSAFSSPNFGILAKSRTFLSPTLTFLVPMMTFSCPTFTFSVILRVSNSC